MPRPWTVIALLALTLAVPGCGSEKPSSGDSAKAAQQDDAVKAADRQFDKEDREFDKAFTESDFDRVVANLPIGRPPLYVRQFITGDGHKLYTAVARKRFCATPVATRKQAVTAFFTSADRSFRQAGVKDFEQVVTPLSENVDKLPALATAGAGAVSLTARGRNC